MRGGERPTLRVIHAGAARPQGPAGVRRRAVDLPAAAAPTTGAPLPLPEPVLARVHRLRPVDAGAEPFRVGQEADGYLIDDGETDHVLLLAGADVRTLPRGGGGTEMIERARRGAEAWHREQLRIARRLALPERLIAYAEQLGHARGTRGVLRALVEHTPSIAGGYCALLLSADPVEPSLPVGDDDPLHRQLSELSVPPSPRLERPCLITAEDALSDTGSPFNRLSPLFVELGARTLAAVPFAGMVLVLVERRVDRLFEPEDWDLLRTLTRQAETALERVRLFDEVRDLSLTDPLTGLANRRQLGLVLERGLAAARRGDCLAVAMLDLDGFKAVNEARGHLGGDRLLRRVAEALAAEARGSDLVARYGGDEFIVVLPGGNGPSAASLLRRVRLRLADEVALSAGVAEYGPGCTTAERLIEAADRDLFRAKERRGPPAPPAAGFRSDTRRSVS
jgi:diguanylate cyclase (GGDEF)-like protein